MLSRMSRRRCSGSLEDTDFFSESISRNVRFERLAEGDVYSLRNEFLDLSDNSRVVKQINSSLLVEIEDQIDIAVRPLRTARYRAEKGEVPDAEFSKARRGSQEDF
jgi:hypothetical protein